MEAMDVDAWKEASAEKVDLAAMDKIMLEYFESRKKHDKAKEESAKAYHELEEAEKRLMDILKAAGKKTYIAEGIGRITIKNKYVVTTPKTAESKWKVLNYIEQEYGKEVRDGYISVNHQSLNSFYNAEKEKHIKEAGFHIDGLDLPTIQESIQFTKAKP